MEHDPTEIAVVGAGGAGTMAYLRAVLNGNRATLFLGDSETKRKGRATWVMGVDNMPGFHDLKRPITSTTKTTLKWIAEQEDLGAGSRTLPGKIESIETVPGPHGFRLRWTQKGAPHEMLARYVVIATGIMDIQPSIGGTIEPLLPFANRGDAIYCVRCDGHQTLGKRLSLIGNSSMMVHIAAMLIERYGHEQVDLLSNGMEPKLSESALELIDLYGMQLHTEAITEVLGDAKKEGLSGFRLADGSTVDTERTVVALGILPYNELLKELGAELDARGKAKVSAKYESTIPGAFVVGDLVADKKMQIYTGWDGAVDAADEIDLRLRLERREALRAGRSTHPG